jgi:hypothetical protein
MNSTAGASSTSSCAVSPRACVGTNGAHQWVSDSEQPGRALGLGSRVGSLRVVAHQPERGPAVHRGALPVSKRRRGH